MSKNESFRITRQSGLYPENNLINIIFHPAESGNPTQSVEKRISFNEEYKF